MRKAAILIISFILLIAVLNIAVADQEIRPGAYVLGTKINDFTFTTYTGEKIALYDVLKEKDMVLINVWASWCGPCKMEFPFLLEAYAAYQDSVEVIALSCETTDTDRKLSEFAASYGLTFKVGRDPVNFLRALNMNSVPVSLVVDRYGTICFIKAGTQTSTDAFTRLFDVFVGSDYTESVLLTDIPPVRPVLEAASDEEISEALDADARNVTARNIWPMAKTEKDGRSVMASTNRGYPSTTAAVEATVRAEAGDAIVITFKTSTESVFDPLKIFVDDELMKCFAGEHDWMSYAIPVNEAGVYTVTVAYTKDHITDSGDDAVWIDSIYVVADSAAVLAENPQYPVHDYISLALTTPSARQITIEDPVGILADAFGQAQYYVINSDTVEGIATLTENVDPEQAFFVSNYDNSYISLADVGSAEGYHFTTGVDSIDASGYYFSYVMLYRNPSDQSPLLIINFRDEENLNRFIQQYSLGPWAYVEAETDHAESFPTLGDEIVYRIKCIDSEGTPIPGVILQICDDSTCQVVTTDADGVYSMVTAPYPWEVHILVAPAGYKAETTSQAFPLEGGEIIYNLGKE